jgi:elongation factor 1 alpha-like protein
MSRHKLVKNLDLDKELDDFEGGTYYEDGDEGGKSSQSSQPVCFFLTMCPRNQRGR